MLRVIVGRTKKTMRRPNHRTQPKNLPNLKTSKPAQSVFAPPAIPASSIRPTSVCLALAILLPLILHSFANAQTPENLDQFENRELEQWLSENKLDTLLLEHLESRLQQTNDQQQRRQIAEKLAGLYADQLLQKEGQTQQWLDRTKALVALYPAFESGQLRVATLHARYMEIEIRFREWWNNGAWANDADEQKHSTFQENLATLARDLDAVSSALKERSAELFAIRQIRFAARANTNESRLVDAELLHCHFLAGWTGYFRAIIDQDFSQERLDVANFRFREFLQLDQKAAITEYDSRWFDFASSWQIRAMVGLAYIETIRGKNDRAAHIWNLLSSNGLGKDRDLFELNSHCFAGQFTQAAELASKVLAPTRVTRPGNIAFAVTAAHAARVAQATQPEAAKRLGDLALAGLARERAGQPLLKHIGRLGKFAPRRNAPPIEHMVWGYLLFWRAERSQQDDLLEQSREYLQRAVVRFGGDQTRPDEILDRERSRFLVAWVDLEEEKFADAADRFATVANNVALLDAELAAEAMWQSTNLSIRISKRKNPAGHSAMLLDRFIQRFPESRFATTAKLERMRLELASLPPQTALQRLGEIPPDHPARSTVLLETLRQELRLWSSQNDDPRNNSLDRVRNACQQVESFKESTSAQKSLACQILLDGLLRDKNANPPDIIRTLDRAKSWRGESLTDDLLYREFLVSQRLGRSADIERTAAALLSSSNKSRFELPVLISLAQLRDQQLSADDSNEQLIQSTMQTYLQLSSRLGTDNETLLSNRNARVAFARLGELQVEAGFLIEARTTLRKLAELFPSQTRYLLALAMAETQSGNNEKAIELYQKLASGVQPGSDLWFDAKLRTVNILATDDESAALKLLKQTRLLGGEIPSHWELQMKEIEQELSQ